MFIFSAVRHLLFGNQETSSTAYLTSETEGERKLAPMFRKVQKICRQIPGSQFHVGIEEGRISLVMYWTPRADAREHFEKCRFVVDAAGGREIVGEENRVDGKRFSVKDADAENIDAKEKQTADRTPGLIRRVADYLTSRYYFRFNVLTEQTEYAERTEDEAHIVYQQVDKRALNTLALDALEADIACWDRDIQRFVHSKRVAPYHPFVDYMNRLPEWDGRNRVAELAARVSDNLVWQNGFHRWMLGMAAQWMNFDMKKHANSVAPLLVSDEQGWGKSTFCRTLLPDALSAYYTDSFDLNAPAACEQKLASFGLINIDEFDRLPVSKMPLLKNLMQMPELNIRKAYRQSHSTLHRIASFIGTSNMDNLLTDRSGSRRFLCVKLTHPIDCVTAIDHTQLYAQLKAELQVGERYWFTKTEEAEIRRNNALFYKHIPEEDLFSTVFRFATPDDREEDVQQLNAAQIFETLKQVHPAAMRGITAYALSRLLPQMGERIHTMKGNVYRVVRMA